MAAGPELSGGDWGWIVAAAVSTWGIVLRFVIGHYVKVGDKLDNRLEKIEGRLDHIEDRLTNIEARSHNRRQGD